MAVLVVCFLVTALLANTDLMEGRHALFMDERISFDESFQIASASNLKSILRAFFEGDQRYGRSFFYLTGFFSWLPYRLFGEPGLIIAGRMFQALLLLGAYLLFIFSFIYQPLLRLLAFVSLVSLPFTPYFATMPKPEPLQLMLLAVFFFIWKQKNEIRPWTFLLVGFAFGTKISLAIGVFVLGAVALISWRPKGTLDKLLPAGLWFCLGWVLAVPILLQGRFTEYLGATFLNTSHGADNKMVGSWQWLQLINKEYLPIAPASGLLIFYFAFSVFSKLKRSKSEVSSELGLALMSLALSLPIIFKVQRLWGFYLHNGFVLFLVGVFAFISEDWFAKKNRHWNYLVLVLMLWLAVIQVPRRAFEFRVLAERTQTEDHRKRAQEYGEVISYLKALGHERKRLTVYYDPGLYIPSSNEHWLINPVWGYFQDWSQGADIVVASSNCVPFKGLDLDPANVSYGSLQRARELYQKHLSQNGSCILKPCYEIAKKVGEDVIIFSRQEKSGF